MCFGCADDRDRASRGHSSQTDPKIALTVNSEAGKAAQPWPPFKSCRSTTVPVSSNLFQSPVMYNTVS